MTFDAKDAQLTAWSYNGHPILYPGKGAKYDNFRWIENEAPYTSVPYYKQKPDHKVPDFDIFGSKPQVSTLQNGQKVVVTAENEGRVPNTLTYTIHADGTVLLDASFSYNSGKLRRLGVSMGFDRKYNNLDYTAKGPQENYVDRQEGSFFGRYKTVVDSNIVNYARTQTCGNRMVSVSKHKDKLTSPSFPTTITNSLTWNTGGNSKLLSTTLPTSMPSNKDSVAEVADLLKRSSPISQRSRRCP